MDKIYPSYHSDVPFYSLAILFPEERDLGFYPIEE